jgi:mannosyltransferase
MRFLYRNQRLIVIICIAFALEVCVHVYNRRVVRPAVNLDPPFHSSCQEPNVNGRRENATILMLARNTELAGAVKSVRSIEEQFNRFFHYPIVFLNDKPWEQTFVDALTKEASGLVIFDVISPEQWGFPEWINEKAAKKSMAKQKANGLLYGGQENYHHMCRFNSGKFYDHPAMQKYKWYWRVEPDVEFTCAIT